MPSWSALRAHNASTKLANATFLVVGGTAGIGRATALKLAAMNASVSVAGRNAAAGSAIVTEMQKLNPDGKMEFLPIDMTLLADVRRFAKEFAAAHSSLRGLVISAGFMSMNGRTETVEGIDQKLAVHYYSRQLLFKKLMPMLEASAASGQDARLMSIFASCLGNTVNFDDMDLKHTYSLKAAADAASGYNDLAVDALSKKHPTVPAIHIRPGMVGTGLIDGFPFYLRLPAKALLSVAGTSPEDCAEAMVYALTAPEYNKGWWLLTQKADILKPNTKYHNDATRDKVWAHTEQLIAEK
ncbi:hypothetical protein HDU89_007420 [Geranomyces variabilis]|nr:hypothetical protein HDU89_007420 [Geranomyces variabilis]